MKITPRIRFETQSLSSLFAGIAVLGGNFSDTAAKLVV